MELHPGAHVNDDDILEKLYSQLTEERKSGELVPLPSGFYASTANTTGLKTEDVERIRSNKDKLLNTLKTIRLQKILIYLAYNRQLPNQMPEEEEKLYKKLKATIEEEKGIAQETVTILADLPEVISPDGSKLGPYRKGETIATTPNELAFILKNKIGEQTR